MSFSFSLRLLLHVFDDGCSVFVCASHQHALVDVEYFGAFVHVGGAYDFVRYDCYALYDVLSQFCSLDGVALDLLEQQSCLEENED